MENLKQRVKDFADILFQKHLLDLTERPEVPWVYYKRPERAKVLTKFQREGYGKYINTKDIKGVSHYFREEYRKFFYPQLENRFQKFVPTSSKIKIPDFSSVEEAILWWSHLFQDYSEEFDFYRKQEKLLKKIAITPYLDIARDYPHLLRFQPCSFDLPDGEDSQYWAKRTNDYLDKKCTAENIPHWISCYDRELVSPSIGFYRVLTVNHDLAQQIVGKLQSSLSGVKMDIIEVDSDSGSSLTKTS